MKLASFLRTSALACISLALAGLAYGQLAPGVTLNFDANDPASGIDSTTNPLLPNLRPIWRIVNDGD